MMEDQTEPAKIETTYCPFKAPSRSDGVPGAHPVSMKRFEQRPGMTFVRASLSNLQQGRLNWPARSFLQIAFICSGTVELIQHGEKRVKPNAGDWLLIKPAQEPLEFHVEEASEVFWIGFDQQATAELTGFSDTISPELIDEAKPHLSCHSSAGRLLSIAEELAGLEGNNTRERLMIESKSLEWLVLILDQPLFSPCRAIAPIRDTRDSIALAAAARIMSDRYSEDHSIASLSRTVHLNEFKLKRGFKEHYGTTVFGYLRQIRMERAREMLERRDKSVIEIANSVGYSNPSHFARAFKQAFGMNPSELLPSSR
ncbi:helix-turn-helix transcriptional regulator [Pelagicoccus albus]|uniref:Helix-turn-helix transcriptional regulator n=1 Tax=Pelagicoccus albus TaxID=415222 RepID=A0A7X1B5C2_9BACT|nr:AraC family transcriptional regulator [Pelagicoccus albus]MBC2605907.1 helix-turn-helix transcriptional regulator [Pelagicoccus albus]